jgi:hypothetical protein
MFADELQKVFLRDTVRNVPHLTVLKEHDKRFGESRTPP